jgi:very-short-patch-repair endonuclease
MNIPFERTFASHEKSKYWSKKNTENPRNVFKSTHVKFWFDCPDCNHCFDSQLNNIVSGQWCTFCSNNRLCNETQCTTCYEKSFASHEKSKYWSSKNRENPKNVFKSTHVKFWFDCPVCNHTFDAPLNSIVKGCWCPFCSNPPKQLCSEKECISCYEKSFTSHEKGKYWSSRNTENPRNVFKSTGKKFWFECPDCNHPFESQLSHIIEGKWCSFCSNNRLCNQQECKTCYEKSFASHEKGQFWSNKNVEKPRNVFKSSNKKFWFDCPRCNHTFESQLNNIINGCWCPFCSNHRLCNQQECKTCYEKSFASHEKSKYWSSRNTENPRNVFKSSGNKFWFDCPVCNHTFDAPLNSIVKGCWCSFCSNNRLCNQQECKTCYEKSFASHEKSKYWSSRNTENPRNVFKSSGNKFWFDCPKCNDSFESQLSSINNGCWCPFCKNKTEAKLYEKILSIQSSLIRQFKQEWCKKKFQLPFDFCIPEYKIIIELDGRQHFQQVSNWSSPEEQFENDKFKEECANNNGYSVIRLLQEDVLYDTYDWVKELCDAIEEIKTSNEITNIYLSKNNEYDNF